MIVCCRVSGTKHLETASCKYCIVLLEVRTLDKHRLLTMDPSTALVLGDSIIALCRHIHQLAKNAKVHKRICKEFAAFLQCTENIVSEVKSSKRLANDKLISEPLSLLKSNLEEAQSLLEECSTRRTAFNVFRNVSSEFKLIEGEIQKYNTLITLALCTRNSRADLPWRQESLAHISSTPVEAARGDDGGATSQSFSARCLAVTWGHDPRYWKWIRHMPGARSPEVAFLVETVWLEVHGKVQCRLEPGDYTLTWRLKLEHPHRRGFGDGWRHIPVKFRVYTSLGQDETCQVPLGRSSGLWWSRRTIPSRDVGARWREFDVAKIVVGTDQRVLDLFFSMTETDNSSWKRGLYVDGVYLHKKMAG